ncbi:MAG: hypothetical protein LIO57_05595, partial [Oscillospiraceae bacterium]|nr:hypothetical protein [Oscillospiraceae bacterium]
VGYHIWTTHRKLKKQTARRMIRHVTTMCEMLNAGEMSREAFDRVAASYGGVLKHCDSYGLRTKLNAIYTEKVEGGKDHGHTNHKSGARGVPPDGQR